MLVGVVVNKIFQFLIFVHLFVKRLIPSVCAVTVLLRARMSPHLDCWSVFLKLKNYGEFLARKSNESFQKSSSAIFC